MAKSILKRTRFKRGFVSPQGALVMALITVLPPIVAFIYQASYSTTTPPDSNTRWFIYALVIGWLLGLAYVVIQAYFEYQRRTYDWTLILKYQDGFLEMTEERAKAAQILKELEADLANIKNKKKELQDIDAVLDFFEDIGFYMYGHQLSPEVVHHHFYHWIRGYYLSAQTYINAWQNNSEVGEPARWGKIKELYEVTQEIEKSIAQEKPFQRTEFLEEEISSNEKAI